MLCACACMMYETDQCRTHLNLLWFLCMLGWGVGVGGRSRGGGGPFRILFCVGCFGGTVICVYRLICIMGALRELMRV